MAIIKKKIWPEYFEAVASGRKKYELRLNDFEANPGDTLVLEEWDPATREYTGRKTEQKITHVGRFKMDKLFWPEEEIKAKGIQIISLEPVKVVAVSGGFDPIHIGHVRMFKEAKALGDKLVVIINNDNWLKKKKSFVFMPQEERKEVIEAIGWVDEAVFTDHEPEPEDMSICEALKKVRPHIFANGGDRTHDNIPEIPVCEEIGCQMVFNVGFGGKVQSSSELVKRYREKQV
ncbi:MAG: DUF3850 domain-containing protein [bacterium]